MSRAYQRGIMHKQPGLVKLIGKVTVGAAGAITVASTETPGCSIVRTSTGKYTITPADKQVKFIGGHVSIQKATIANVQSQIGSQSMSTPTIVVDFYEVDQSPNALLDPVSLVWYYEFNLDHSSASQY
jgi:hypothetical protein